MSPTVCLISNTLAYPQGGGHLWVHLNWALGLRSAGCDVLWLEVIDERIAPEHLESCVAHLKKSLAPFGLSDATAFCRKSGDDLDRVFEADLVLSMLYTVPAWLAKSFRRSALLDIDPGLLQLFVSQGQMSLPKHDLYFTIGETVGRPEARFPDAGLRWHYTPPCVALDWWPLQEVCADAPFTTVSHWYSDEWVKDADGYYPNEKREGFLPYLELPRHTSQTLELALCLRGDERERTALEGCGWKVREAWEVTATPSDYQHYIQRSRGEFSCVKPSCVRLQNAWISDRTLCYLASGRPAVVQHTGPSRFLPDGEGLFRFRDFDEAVTALETVAADYDRQRGLARALAEEYFDARKVASRLLERALT